MKVKGLGRREEQWVQKYTEKGQRERRERHREKIISCKCMEALNEYNYGLQ